MIILFRFPKIFYGNTVTLKVMHQLSMREFRKNRGFIKFAGRENFTGISRSKREAREYSVAWLPMKER
jgi:hypothetical protein